MNDESLEIILERIDNEFETFIHNQRKKRWGMQRTREELDIKKRQALSAKGGIEAKIKALDVIYKTATELETSWNAEERKQRQTLLEFESIMLSAMYSAEADDKREKSIECVLICYGFRPIVFQAGTTAEAAAKAAALAKAQGAKAYICYNRNAELIAESGSGKDGTQ